MVLWQNPPIGQARLQNVLAVETLIGFITGIPVPEFEFSIEFSI
jgi:hypothetical protein